MFSRSEKEFSVKYTNYIDDNDSKTFEAIDLQPYSENQTVRKIECVAHVEKRMGTRLKNIKEKEKLEGHGQLTDRLIQKLTKFYGFAIRRHPDSVNEIKKTVKYLLSHMFNKNLQHQYCSSRAVKPVQVTSCRSDKKTS